MLGRPCSTAGVENVAIVTPLTARRLEDSK